jgi:hypothetical protein
MIKKRLRQIEFFKHLKKGRPGAGAKRRSA